MFSVYSRFAPRKLRSHTQLLVAVLLALFVVLAIVTSWYTLRSSFDQFERDSVTQELSRLELWLNEELESLRRSANDYAIWDDSYLFTQGVNSGYAEENFSSDVFDNLDLDLFAIVTPEGEIYHARQRSENGAGETVLVPLNEEMALWLRKRPVITMVQRSLEAKGVINHFKDVPVLIGAAPVLHSDYRGPSAGTLLMLRIFDARRIAADNPLSGTMWQISELAPGSSIITGISQSANRIQITRRMEGVNDEGVTTISLKSEAQLQEQFATAIRIGSLNLALMAVITLLLIGFVLNRLVLNRLLFFSRRADDIRVSGDLAL